MTDRRELLRGLLGLPVAAAASTAVASQASATQASPGVDIAATVPADESTLLVFRLTERCTQESYDRVLDCIKATLKHFNVNAPAILLPSSVEFDYVRLSAKDRQDATSTG